MPDKTYKMIELVGSSERSIEEAIQNAITRASRTLKGLQWFQVTEMRGVVQEGTVKQFQVALKVGFKILDDADIKGA